MGSIPFPAWNGKTNCNQDRPSLQFQSCWDVQEFNVLDGKVSAAHPKKMNNWFLAFFSQNGFCGEESEQCERCNNGIGTWQINLKWEWPLMGSAVITFCCRDVKTMCHISAVVATTKTFILPNLFKWTCINHTCICLQFLLWIWLNGQVWRTSWAWTSQMYVAVVD